MKHIVVGIAGLLALASAPATGQMIAQEDGLFDQSFSASSKLKDRLDSGWSVVSVRLVTGARCGDASPHKDQACSFREFVLSRTPGTAAVSPSSPALPVGTVQICRLGSWNGTSGEFRCKTFG